MMFLKPFLVNPPINSLSPVQSLMSRNRQRATKVMSSISMSLTKSAAFCQNSKGIVLSEKKSTCLYTKNSTSPYSRSSYPVNLIILSLWSLIQKAMFIFLPPTLIDFSGEFVYIFLGRLALGNKFFVPQVVQKSLNLLDINIRWQFYDDCVCRAFDGHDK